MSNVDASLQNIEYDWLLTLPPRGEPSSLLSSSILLLFSSFAEFLYRNSNRFLIHLNSYFSRKRGIERSKVNYLESYIQVKICLEGSEEEIDFKCSIGNDRWARVIIEANTILSAKN